jgi:hypothetical protein
MASTLANSGVVAMTKKLPVFVPATTFCPSPKLSAKKRRGATNITPGTLLTTSMSSLVSHTWRPGPCPW